MAVDDCRLMDELKPMGAMILVQVVFAGVNVFYKLAMNDGMNVEVLVAYRYLFATAFLCPVAFVVERGRRPRLTGVILMYSFLNGLFGVRIVPCTTGVVERPSQKASQKP